MPPPLALLAYGLLVLWLLLRDVKSHPNLSPVLWIPTLWILLISSRSISAWTYGESGLSSADVYLDGSPLDRNVFVLFLVVGSLVLARRAAQWTPLVRPNLIVILFLTYALVSVLWSDYPVVSFKRWLKVVGHVVMALVVLTEPDPKVASRALLRRAGYILIPLSIVFIKYFPHLGRAFEWWNGAASNTGVTTNKNLLGVHCLVFGILFTTSLFAKSDGSKPLPATERYISLAFVAMSAWLLLNANSAAAIASTVVGSIVVVATRTRIGTLHFTKLLLATVLSLAALQSTTNIRDAVIEGLGRDTTLTGRTYLWETLGTIHVNPFFGTGFESFWLGERLDNLWRQYWWKPNQAHNGYYETYLNLGLVGVTLQLLMIAVYYYRATEGLRLSRRGPGGLTTLCYVTAQYRLAFLLALLVLNVTDATFKATHMTFFLFFLFSLESSLPVVGSEPLRLPRRVFPIGYTNYRMTFGTTNGQRECRPGRA